MIKAHYMDYFQYGYIIPVFLLVFYQMYCAFNVLNKTGSSKLPTVCLNALLHFTLSKVATCTHRGILTALLGVNL